MYMPIAFWTKFRWRKPTYVAKFCPCFLEKLQGPIGWHETSQIILGSSGLLKSNAWK